MPPKKRNNRKKNNVSAASERAKVKQLTNLVGQELAAIKKTGKLEASNADNIKKVYDIVDKQKRATARAVKGSKVFRDLEGWVRDFIFINAETPPLPSLFKERCQVHNLQFNYSVPIEYRTPDGYYSFLTQPSFEKFLRLAKPGTSNMTAKDDSETSVTNHATDTGLMPADVFLCSDKSWTMTNTAELAPVKAKSSTFPSGSFHWSGTREAWTPGLKIYPVGSIIAGDEPLIHFKSQADSPVTVQSFFHVYDSSQNHLLEVSSAPTVCPAQDGIDLPFTPGQWANVVAQYPVTSFFSYGVKVTNGGNDIPRMGSDVRTVINMGLQHFTFGTPLIYESKSLLDVVCADGEGRQALEAQYAQASHIKFGLYEVTIKNGTAKMAKAGFVCSAQYPGRVASQQVTMSPQDHFGVIATMPVNSSGLMDFDHGQHYFFKPEKIQDWLYKQATDDEAMKEFLEHDVPKVATGIFAPDQLGSTPIVNLTGWVHYELLTMDRSCNQCTAGGNVLNQLDTLLAGMRAIPQFTENPSHLKTLGNAISSVVRSPVFKKLVTDLGTMGIEMLLV